MKNRHIQKSKRITKSSISGKKVPLAICPVTDKRKTVLLSAKLILTTDLQIVLNGLKKTLEKYKNNYSQFCDGMLLFIEKGVGLFFIPGLKFYFPMFLLYLDELSIFYLRGCS